MLDVYLLGTAGTMPLPYRFLTSCLVRSKGRSVLIDCGEGTQVALNQQKLSFKKIDTILLTHFHTDHTGGLPGLLLSMAKSERTEPITVIGPKGLEEILKSVYTLARYIPFPIQYVELSENVESFDYEEFSISAFRVQHNVLTYGYAFDVKRNRKFIKEKAEALSIPVKLWSILQKGQEVVVEDKTITPDQVLGEARKGIRFVYATDTRPNDNLIEFSKDADLLVTEGMYGDKEKQELAVKNKHMMMQEAAQIAKDAHAKELWLTHFSASMIHPKEYTEEIQEIFANTTIASDGQHTTLMFAESENGNV